jgi:hypothetical protein
MLIDIFTDTGNCIPTPPLCDDGYEMSTKFSNTCAEICAQMIPALLLIQLQPVYTHLWIAMILTSALMIFAWLQLDVSTHLLCANPLPDAS